MIEQANLRIWGDAIKGGLLPFAILMLVVLMVCLLYTSRCV